MNDIVNKMIQDSLYKTIIDNSMCHIRPNDPLDKKKIMCFRKMSYNLYLKIIFESF